MQPKLPTAILHSIRNICNDYPRPFWVLMGGTFIDRLGTNLIMPFLAIYVVDRFNAQFTQVGVIYTILAVSGAAGNFLAGALADRFGRRLKDCFLKPFLYTDNTDYAVFHRKIP